MRRSIRVLPIISLMLAMACVAGAQDLGSAAKAAKEKKQAASPSRTVYTNEMLSSKPVTISDTTPTKKSNCRTVVTTPQKTLSHDNEGTPIYLESSTEQPKSEEVCEEVPDASAQAAPGASPMASADSGTAEADKAKQADEIRSKISSIKQQIDLNQQQIDILQREAKLRATAFYSNAGAKLQNEKQYQEDERKAQADLQSKQQKVDSLKSQLSQLQNEGRRLGMPASSLQ